MTGTCPDCNFEKLLTVKGLCWKCQVGSISTGKKKGCKTCGEGVQRITQNITTKRTTQEIPT